MNPENAIEVRNVQKKFKVYLDKGKVVDVTIAVYAGSNCIVSDTSIDNLKSNYDTYCRFYSVA